MKPREAFLHAVMFLALFVSAFNLGALVFGGVDLAFPHPQDPPEEVTRDGIRWAVSLLVVACPVFLYVAAVIRRAVASDPSARASRLRQQLTYVTLFIASFVLLGSVAAVVHNFLDGAVDRAFRAEGAHGGRHRRQRVRVLPPGPARRGDRSRDLSRRDAMTDCR